MGKSTFNITFFLRKEKPLKTGEFPISIRITLNGERATFNAKHNVKPEIWNQKTNRAVGKSAYAKSINKYLDHVYIRLCDSMRDLEERGLEVTAENIKNNYLGFMEHKQITLLSLYQEHNDKMKALIGKGYAFSTLEKHYTTIGHLKEFIPFKYKANDLAIDKIDSKFISEFEFCLKSEKNISNNTTIKYIKNLGKIIRTAVQANYMKNNPYSGIRPHYDEIDRPFLDIEELQKLIQTGFEIKRLEQIKDVFLFCCFTGLAFVDVKNLKEEYIIRNGNNEVWIRKPREKTNNMCNIPLLNIPKRLLEKYKDDKDCQLRGQLLPVPTNQKYNAYLKEVADLCGINKRLTSHLARHEESTFSL